jgi:hypothetical protein
MNIFFQLLKKLSHKTPAPPPPSSRSWDRIPMSSLDFSTDLNLAATLWPWGWLSLQQKLVPGIFRGGVNGWPARKADNLATIYEPTVHNMWEPRPLTPVCLHGLLQGQLYLFFYNNNARISHFKDKHSSTINSDPAHYLAHAFNNSFPNIQLNFSTTKEIESIIKSLKLENTCRL